MKRCLQRALLGGWLLLAASGPNLPSRAVAQDPAPAKSAVTTTSTSSYVVEYGMVIVMFGAALFAVCRSSRRNV